MAAISRAVTPTSNDEEVVVWQTRICMSCGSTNHESIDCQVAVDPGDSFARGDDSVNYGAAGGRPGRGGRRGGRR